MEAPPVLHSRRSSESLSPKLNLMDLPTELHFPIADHLPYPDALALKHTCGHFYHLVDTGVKKKVDWLVERFERKLECPMEKCCFRTDEVFCNSRMRKLMERRRRHLECRRMKGGCMVVEGNTCQIDLVPVWLKRNGGLISLAFWGDEGKSNIRFLSICLGGVSI